MDRPESLSHSRWECKYHVVLIPKYRRRGLYAQLRRHLGEVFHPLARQKESTIEEGHWLPDHVRMLLAIPPKYAVSQVIGLTKVRSTWRGCMASVGAISPGRIFGRGAASSRPSVKTKQWFAPTFVGRKRKIAGWVNSILTRMNPLQGVTGR